MNENEENWTETYDDLAIASRIEPGVWPDDDERGVINNFRKSSLVRRWDAGSSIFVDYFGVSAHVWINKLSEFSWSTAFAMLVGKSKLY